MIDFEKIAGEGIYGQYFREVVEKIITDSHTFQDVLDNGLRKIYENLIPAQSAGAVADLCEIVKRLGLYMPSPSSYRRSHRSSDVRDYSAKILYAAQSAFCDWEKFDLIQWLTTNDDGRYKPNDNTAPNYTTLSMLIALKIDQNDKDVTDTLSNLILSENNTRVLSRTIMTGIAMSHNKELHALMQKLLLAAKLQEGLRQSILETADDGTVDYFKMLIKTVLDNDLLRFSSALRAVLVWMGINYDYSDRRVVEKILKLGYEYISDEKKRAEAIGSADVTQMFAAMWAESVFSLQNLDAHIQSCMRGEKYQKLVGAYFLNQSESADTKVRLAGDALAGASMDMDAAALFFNAYSFHGAHLNNVSEPGCEKNCWNCTKKKIVHNKYPAYLQDKSVRGRHFSSLSNIIEKIPKNGHTVAGKPFEWCSFAMMRGNVFASMMFLAAYDFDGGMQARLIELFPGAEQQKGTFIDYFIARDTTGGNRDFLFGCLSDKSMPVRSQAVEIMEKMELSGEEILRVEELLSLKSGGLRQSALKVIQNAGHDAALASAKRLIADKSENKRLAALDLLSAAKKSGKVSGADIREICAAAPKTTDAEAIIITNLLEEEAAEYTPDNGFGLYERAYFPKLPPVKSDGKNLLKAFAEITSSDMEKVFDSLCALIAKHKDHEYRIKLYDGVHDCILGNATRLDVLEGKSEYLKQGQTREAEDYVLSGVWLEWLEQNRGNLLTLYKIRYSENVRHYNGGYDYGDLLPFAVKILEKTLGCGEVKAFVKINSEKMYAKLAGSIISNMLHMAFDLHETMYSIAADLFLSVNSAEKENWGKLCYNEKNEGKNRLYYKHRTTLARLPEVTAFTWLPSKKIKETKKTKGTKKTDDYFLKKLSFCYAMGDACGERYYNLSLAYIVRAVSSGLIEKDELYRAIFDLQDTRTVNMYTGAAPEYADKAVLDEPVFAECLNNAVKRIIEIELKRGDSATPVSKYAAAIKRHDGAEVFAGVLVALGKETLARGYSWGGSYTKRDVLSSLLKSSAPAPDDNVKTFGAALGGRVAEKRLIEAVMYAPAWIAIAEEYLGWSGLKCAAWYFHAHTRNSYSSEFETEAARYSPIDKEDFQRGAFDINWFKEAYNTLGGERFNILYDCAKYISDGAAHRRAQLFADAASGKLNIDEAEPQIRDKRNKDLLLAYSLAPFSKSKAKQAKEALRRYEFINEFLKKSREFGAQRQASEKDAANIALENLARNLGYADVLRFRWKMEMEKLDVIQDYFKPKELGGVTLFLEMGEAGLAELIVDKGGKTLKSVPAAIKKDEYVKEINEVKASLKSQFSRARMSLEKAMENRDSFSFGEIRELLEHPVISPLIRKLVFVSGNEAGFLCESGLSGADGETTSLEKDAPLVIAHCYDLFSLGKWGEYQRYAFENGLVQPFKQIFRELYTVNEDEKAEKLVSRRYAGNQIQPKKTVALLKGRGWTVDYENGLQKVYYKENIIAAMYALADWFSPSEVEAPTVETVRFYDRKTGEPLELEKLDAALFSEVMRDIDLVVSVAHVGGVDPMASHSTVEMRGVIAAESARLMKLENVEISGRHAKISGRHGEYTVHLGSAQAHMTGRGALHILPVHSQHRGRIFLPFLDEDPKTAEIVSKILLLAEDDKIKDPTVMSQIYRS